MKTLNHKNIKIPDYNFGLPELDDINYPSHYKLDGLDVPDVCKRETEDYKLEMNPIARFIDERCNVGDANASVKASDLYLNYTSWASANNEYIMSQQKFGREINKEYSKIKKPDGFYYQSIALK